MNLEAIVVCRILICITRDGSLLISADRNSGAYDALRPVGQKHIDDILNVMVDAGIKITTEDPDAETVTLVDNRVKEDDVEFFKKGDVIDAD